MGHPPQHVALLVSVSTKFKMSVKFQLDVCPPLKAQMSVKIQLDVCPPSRIKCPSRHLGESVPPTSHGRDFFILSDLAGECDVLVRQEAIYGAIVF